MREGGPICGTLRYMHVASGKQILCNCLELLNLTRTVLKVFNLVQNYASTIPKQYSM